LDEDAPVALRICVVAEETRLALDEDDVVLAERLSVRLIPEEVEVDRPVPRTVDLDGKEEVEPWDKRRRDERERPDDVVFADLDLDRKVDRLAGIDVVSDETSWLDGERPEVSIRLRVRLVVRLTVVGAREEGANKGSDRGVRRAEGVLAFAKEEETDGDVDGHVRAEGRSLLLLPVGESKTRENAEIACTGKYETKGDGDDVEAGSRGAETYATLKGSGCKKRL
jgi:hypothetical protein